MKIIISNYDDLKNPYYAGGGARAVHEVAKRLALKSDVTVITGKYPGSKIQIIDKVKYERTGLSYFGPKIGQLVFQACLPFLIKTKKYDLWVESFTPPISTACLQLFTKKPVVGLVHMLSGEDMERKYILPFPLLERLGLKTYRYFIVLSNTTKKRIQLFNKKAKFVIAPNGVDIPKVLEYKRREHKHILFIGRIEVNQKGLDLLTKSFENISKRVPFSLVIAGGGSKNEISNLKMLIKSLKLSNKVKLVGKVTGQKKESYFKQAVFAVSPSRFETFPISALEIFSYGLPLISFNINGYKWVPKGSSIKVPPYNLEKLSNAIGNLCADSELRNSLSKKSVTLAKKYNWEKTSSIYDKFIRKAMKG